MKRLLEIWRLLDERRRRLLLIYADGLVTAREKQ